MEWVLIFLLAGLSLSDSNALWTLTNRVALLEAEIYKLKGGKH